MRAYLQVQFRGEAKMFRFPKFILINVQLFGTMCVSHIYLSSHF